MKNIEKIKLICGLVLVSFAILAGLIFYLESFGILNNTLEPYVSYVFTRGESGASNTPIFLGLCGLSGAYLLSSVKN